MSVGRFSIVFAAAALISAAAGGVQAAEKAKTIDFTVRAEPSGPVPGAGGVLKWDAAKGRWGLTLNLGQPNQRPARLNDVEAGAYYRITPSLRVGGSVALGEQQPLAGAKLRPDEGQPRVRLETAFKF
jgi:hypothetical protein